MLDSSPENADERFGPLAWVAIAFAVVLGIAKALVWSHGTYSGEVEGYAAAAILVPVGIAYSIAGRRKVRRGGNRFALWLSLLSVFFLLLELSSRKP
jgi:hypothetical protein